MECSTVGNSQSISYLRPTVSPRPYARGFAAC
nr:MAG TPA: hypothetical protein [Bacteriophage sp.]